MLKHLPVVESLDFLEQMQELAQAMQFMKEHYKAQ